MSKTKLLVLLTLLSLAAFAYATPIVYNNGGPNQQNGNEMTEWIQTEDFTLTQTTTVTDVHFWDIETGNAYQGSISWWITPDNNGFPNMGAALLLGQNFDVARTQTQCGILGIYCEYTNDFTFAGPGITLGPGTYHLALHNGDASFNQRSEFYWETTDPNGTAPGLECDLQFVGGPCTTGDGTAFSSNGAEHAFYLTGTTVPEPGSLMLMGTGLLGAIAGLRRRF